jgi:hypothetical protein
LPRSAPQCQEHRRPPPPRRRPQARACAPAAAHLDAQLPPLARLGALDRHHQLRLVRGHVAGRLERAQEAEDLTAVGFGGLRGVGMATSSECLGWEAAASAWAGVRGSGRRPKGGSMLADSGAPAGARPRAAAAEPRPPSFLPGGRAVPTSFQLLQRPLTSSDTSSAPMTALGSCVRANAAAGAHRAESRRAVKAGLAARPAASRCAPAAIAPSWRGTGPCPRGGLCIARA